MNFQHFRRHVTQDHLFIWFDPDLDETSEDHQITLEHLQSLTDTIDIFTNPDEFVDFLTDLENIKVFLVMGDTSAQQIISFLHDIPQLDQIHILCHQAPSSNEWLNEWTKINGIHSDIASLCATLTISIQQRHQNAIPTSVVSLDEINGCQSLNELEPSFMYSQIFKDILLNMQYDDVSFCEFIKYCRVNHFGSSRNIKLFENEYRNRSPIWWYVWPAFIFEMLNYALRTLQSDILIKMGFFICELHREIQRLYEEQRPGYRGRPFHLYRGQGLSTEAFHKLVETKGGLMSFNSFLSTSAAEDVSRNFAVIASTIADTVGIVFEMTINPGISSTPFACVEQRDDLPREAETLFSMHAVFRIVDVRRYDNDSQLYKVELALTAEDDKDLRRLTNWFADDVQDSIGWKRLGSLLLKIGQLEKAEEFYKTVLEETTDDRVKMHYYSQLALIKQEQGDDRMYGWYLLKTTELEKKTLSGNHAAPTASTGDVNAIRLSGDEDHQGLIFYRTAGHITPEQIYSSTVALTEQLEDFEATSDRIEFLEEALEAFKKILSTEHGHWPTSSDHVDIVDDELRQSSLTIWFQRKLLEVRQRLLPPNHSDIARSYAVIASLYSHREEYRQARSFYEKSIELYQQILPPNHPMLACLYNNIGMTYTKTDEHATALWFLRKTIQIAERVLPPNHPDLSAAYHNLAEVYDAMGDSSNTVLYDKKQLAVFERSPHPDQMRAVSSCKRIGRAYCNMEQYAEALRFFEKALEVRQQILPSDDLDLADDYEEIGSLYNQIGDYANALLHCDKLVHILENRLPSNDARLPTCYAQIARIHENTENYEQAILFYEKALETSRQLPSTHHNALSACYNNIAGVCVKMRDYPKALLHFEQALSMMNDHVPADDPNLLIIQHNINYLNSECRSSHGR